MNLRLLPASLDDAADLLAWRNHPVTRAQSRQTAELGWDGHVAWLTRMLADPRCLLLVGWRDGRRVGMVRFNQDADGDCWEVSIAVAPDGQGQGLGRALLAQGIAWLRGNHPGAGVVAAVRPGNVASERLFLGAGFTPVPSDEEFAHYRLEA